MTSLPPYHAINDAETLRWLAVDLASETLLAVDTESNSLHAYREQVCLIQLSTRTADYIIDPLLVEDISPLGVLLADPKIEVLFHAAEYDLMSLKRDYGITVANLFDTMVAAQVLGINHYGLSSLLKRYFNIKLDKSHQRDDWGKRPLSADSLRYAQMDTHYLPDLRDRMLDDLNAIGLVEETRELFAEAASVPLPDHSFDPEGYWKLGRPKELRRHEMSVLRELYLWREAAAEMEDVPIFKIMSNKTMLNIATTIPHNSQQLGQIRGLHSGFIRRYGDEVVEAIHRGRKGASNLPQPPPIPQPPPPEIADRYTTLQQWRKKKGVERGMRSEVIINKDVLWDLAYQTPQTLEAVQTVTGLGPRRMEIYGEELVTMMAEFNGEQP